MIGQFPSGHSQTPSEDFARLRLSVYKFVNFSYNLLLYHSMGISMQCLLCGRRSPTSGQFFLKLFRQMAPSVVNVFVRGIVLFILGAFFAMVLFMFSVAPEARRKRIPALDLTIIANLFSAVWWIAPSSGTVAALVGIMYPCSDIRLGKPHKLQREWSSVAKCVGLFLGIGHACAVSFVPCNFIFRSNVKGTSRWILFGLSFFHDPFISGCFQTKRQTFKIPDLCFFTLACENLFIQATQSGLKSFL